MIMSIVIYFDDGPNEPPFVGCFFSAKPGRSLRGQLTRSLSRWLQKKAPAVGYLDHATFGTDEGNDSEGWCELQYKDLSQLYLVGVWNIFYFPIYWE